MEEEEEEVSSGFASVELNGDNIENKMEKTRVELNEDNIENQKEEMGNVEGKVEDPKTGMMFNSIDELMKFYTRYAKEKGFAVAKRTSKKGDNGEVRYVTVACNRGGKQRIRSSNPLKMRAQSKTDCKAKLRAVLCTDGRWVLNSIELDHNHGLSPGRSRFYKCHRILQPHATRKLELNDRAEPLSVIDSSVSLNDGRKVRISYKAVELWLADKTVLPIENSLGGSIHRNYDLLLWHKLHIVGEVQLAVNLCLLALPGVRTEHLKRVLSHPQTCHSDVCNCSSIWCFKICPSLEEQMLEVISIIFQLRYDYKVTRKQLLQALA